MMAPADLRYARTILGLTQVQLGEELDVSSETVRNYESGRAAIPRTFELSIAALMLGLRRFPSRVHEASEEPIRPLDLAFAGRIPLDKQEVLAVQRMRHGLPLAEKRGLQFLGRLFRLGLAQLSPAERAGLKSELSFALSPLGKRAFGEAIQRVDVKKKGAS